MIGKYVPLRIDRRGFLQDAQAVLGRSFKTYDAAFEAVHGLYKAGRPPKTGVPAALWDAFTRHANYRENCEWRKQNGLAYREN